jgi:hypothetical protein
MDEKNIVKCLDGKFLEFYFSTINSTNFSIVWGKKFSKFSISKKYQEKKEKKKKKKTLSTIQKRVG